ncbi:MAG TPA: PEP-CTERM sorting domain-containing protein [Gammaproteobacteria bacterium]|nr:PEP-CTERM sorting domain-containing protein [Gammaproteobacteria bacterium]
MKTGLLAAGAMVAALAFGPLAQAGTFHFQFSGAGVTGSGTLTITPDTNSGDPSSAFTITGVSGTFADANIGISNASITGLVPLNPFDPPRGGIVPASESFFPVNNPPPNAGGPVLTYDNLFFPDGSPVDCPDFPYNGGGFLDVYGMMMTLDNGNVVDFWSDGAGSPLGADVTYGVGVIAPGGEGGNTLTDYQFAGVTATASVPEPQYLWLLGAALLGFFAWRRRSSVRATVRARRGRRY